MLRKSIGLFLILAGATYTGLAANGPESSAGAPKPAVTPAEASSPAGNLSEFDFKAVLQQAQIAIRKQAEQLEAQRQQLERQQSAIEALQRELDSRRSDSAAADRQRTFEQEQAASSTAALLNHESISLRSGSGGNVPFASSAEGAIPALRPSTSGRTTLPAGQASTAPPSVQEISDPPLSIHFGSASLTPGGWVDFTGYFRSTNVGSGLGTSFASIPFNNTVNGGLTETRFTAQSSRITLRADENFGNTKVFGYGEADFNGYLPANAYVSTNSDTLRMRVYFSDVSRGNWEFLGGQSWSLLTPNRIGVSPFLSEIYNTIHLDTNYQVGLTYARQAQIRAVYHFNKAIALGVSAENPEQYSGSAVSFPTLFSNTETDVNSSTGSGGGTATPTLHPDVVAKLSVDPIVAGHHWHLETSGLLTPVEILTPASVTKATSAKDERDGGGVSMSANVEPVKGLHFILTGFWSDGGGRYIGGLGPGFVVAQLGSKTASFTAQLVHSGSGIANIEWQASKSTLVSFAYSGAYFDRVFSTDPSTNSLVGYGFKGSANSNNRDIQEATIGTQTIIWKRAGYGSVSVITQGSWTNRTPWYVGTNAPKNAHVYAQYTNLRYVLP